MAEFEIRWSSAECAMAPIGDPLNLEEASGLSADELAELTSEAEAILGERPLVLARASSAGKGASGPAFAIVVEIERIFNDSASLLAWGIFLNSLIRRISHKKGKDPVIEDGKTLGALSMAVATKEGVVDDGDTDMTLIQTVPLTTTPGMGTNASDVWVSVFRRSDDNLRLVYITPAGRLVGAAVVPNLD